VQLLNYDNYGRLWRVYGKSVLRYGTPRKIVNALRTEWAYRRRTVDVKTHPYILFIEPIYYCNLRCPLCPREKSPDARSDDKSRLPLDLLDRIFDEIGDSLFQCQIFGNGEPMLDWPRTKHVIQTAHRRRIYTLVSTNCTIMTPKIAAEVVTSGLDYLICAVDGTTQETYEKYRVGGRFDKAYAGMKMLVDAARKHKSGIMLEWQFLVHQYNHHQMDDARRLADELGIFLRFSPIGGIGEEESAQATWLAPTPDWQQNKETPGQPLHDFPCYWLWRSLVINSNGNLARCPGFSNVAQMASLHEHSIMSVYNGPQSQRARQLFGKAPPPPGDYPNPCIDCTFYPHHHPANERKEKRVSLTVAPDIRANRSRDDSAQPAHSI
jgi:MoaA/NifB/PqqE/SkfB family radical SAM enzyme